MGVAEAGRVERVPAREFVRAEFQARHWAPLVLRAIYVFWCGELGRVRGDRTFAVEKTACQITGMVRRDGLTLRLKCYM